MLHATPLFFGMSDFEEARPHSSRNNINAVLDPAVSAAIQSAISELMGSLTNNLIRLLNLSLAISQTDF